MLRPGLVPRTVAMHHTMICLLQTLESFDAVDSQVAQIAINKVRGHLWYLSENLIGLALFSDQVSAEEKAAMVSALVKPKKCN